MTQVQVFGSIYGLGKPQSKMHPSVVPTLLVVPTRVELVTFAFGERRSKSIELRGICYTEYSFI